MNDRFNCIVVAYDDSTASQNALKMAGNLVKGNPECALYIAHVFEEKVANTALASQPGYQPLRANGFGLEGMPIPPVEDRHEDIYPSTHAQVTNSSDQAIFNAKQITAGLHANTDYEILGGDPAESVCEFAAEKNADLILAGSSQKSGLKKLFVGSTSEKILKNAPCSVLIAQ
jgi:nucleotide-binding universal stress UspA family protein